MNMKKLLAAVLALTLVLAAAGAMAATTVTSRDELVKALREGEKDIILKDITHTGKWDEIGVPSGVTIDGEDSTLIIDETTESSTHAQFFSGNNYTIKNLTIVSQRNTRRSIGIKMNGGLVENVTMQGNIGIGVFGYNGTDVKGCTFDSSINYGISSDLGLGDGFGEVSNNTFNSPRVGPFYYNETFTNNEVNGDSGLSVASSSVTIQNNTFTGERAIEIHVDGMVINNNKFLNDSYIEANAGCTANLTGNYWGGSAPTANRLKENGQNSDIIVESWFTDEAMKNVFDPNAVVGAADMPSTGDNSMIMLWAALLALCAGAALTMKRARA